MLTQSLTLPSVYGAATPTENCADLRTKGWELSITWRDQFKLGGKPLPLRPDGSDRRLPDRNHEVQQPQRSSSTATTKAKSWARSGATTCRNSSTPTREAAAYQVAINNSSNRLPARLQHAEQPGQADGRRRDVRGPRRQRLDRHGRGTVDDPGDMMIIGNTTPRYSYSFRIEASWNGFDISAFFQGVGKRDWYPTANKDDIYGANQFWQLYGYHSVVHHLRLHGRRVERTESGRLLPPPAADPELQRRPAGTEQRPLLQSVAYLRFRELHDRLQRCRC